MNKTYIALILFFVSVAVAGSYVFSSREIADSTPTPAATEVAVASPSGVAKQSIPVQTALATNTWFSSAYQFPSQPMYAYPGVFKVYDKGLGVASPQVKVTADTIFGSYDEFCAVSDGTAVKSTRVAGYGDWNVDFEMTTSKGKLTASVTQGMPYAYISGSPVLSVACKGAVVGKIANGVSVTRGDGVVVFQAEGNNEMDSVSETSFNLTSDSGRYRVVFIPSAEAADIEFFAKQEWNRVVSTRVVYSVEDTQIRTTYEFETEKDAPVVTTVWPHHGQVQGANNALNKQFSTVIGKMRPVSTRGFTSVQARPDLPLQFKKVTNAAQQKKIIEEIKKDADRIAKEKPPEGVYFKGTWIGALTSLVQLADLYGQEEVKKTLLSRLQTELVSSLKEFEYDAERKMYIAKKPEFGNEKGNDHHFHYGYYIRAAAVLLKYSPDSLSAESAVIEQMVEDISSEEFSGSRYPRLRSYSPYEGHSWADGVANFADGNNQESTSEALNAWYAVKLWGEVTSNAALQNRGEWLFSQELAGTKAYWFGIGNPFPTGYEHPMASLVWGGKRDFATWFSPQPMHVYGIQFLPVTPASGYLSTASNGLTIDLALQKTNPVAHEWGDLYLAYQSYFNPESTRNSLPQVRSISGLKLSSLVYQTVYSNGANL